MKKSHIYLFAISLILFTGMRVKADTPAPYSVKADTLTQYSVPPKMEWWYEARFGMFIHFGSYSYLGTGEWVFSNDNWTKERYQTEVSANFNPVDFNAGTIARLAKTAGMKYLVITAKHHEGFSMWNTNVPSFKDVTGEKFYDLEGFTDFGNRDILQELKDSCEAQGIKFGLYYSILDWNHPSQEIFHGENWYTFSTMASDEARTNYINDMKEQLEELITKYDPAILWFDGDWTYNDGSPTPTEWWTRSDGAELHDFLMDLNPDLVVNERVARGFGLGDYESPEQEVPEAPLSRPWETCQTMNTSWGYASWDNNYKSMDSLVHELVRVVSRDGNYLLNIGPKGDGTLTEQTVSILNGYGDWMDVYGESVYGVTRSPYPTEPDWGYFTKKDGKLFAHVFNWPTNGTLRIPSILNTVHKVYLQKDPATELNYTDSSGYLWVSLPTTAPNAHNSVVTVEVTGIPSINYVEVGVHQESTDNNLFSMSFKSIQNGILKIVHENNPVLAVSIYNITGQKVLQRDISGKATTLNLQHLPPGIYSAKVSLPMHNFSEKFKFIIH